MAKPKMAKPPLWRGAHKALGAPLLRWEGSGRTTSPTPQTFEISLIGGIVLASLEHRP